MLIRYILPGLISMGMACSPPGKDYPVFDDPCNELDYFDKEMNDLFNNILEKHMDQTRFIKNMKQAQVMWIQYRNTMTQVYMDKIQRPRDYSKLQRECKCKKMAEFTRKRLEELKPFILEKGEIPSCWDK